MSYENLQALAEGRVSGRVSDWPMLRSEARAVLAENAALRKQLDDLLQGGAMGMTRWEIGFRNIVTAMVGARTPFDIPEIVESVEDQRSEVERLTAALNVAKLSTRQHSDEAWRKQVERLRGALALIASIGTYTDGPELPITAGELRDHARAALAAKEGK